MSAHMLEVENLRVAFPNRDGSLSEAVRGVSFKLGRERLGIVGESGSGKSQTGRAILGLSAPEARISADRLAFDGIDLLRCSAAERRSLRGRRIAMVLQDPKYSLNPVMRIGAQIAETLLAHRAMAAAEAHKRVMQALLDVAIDDPERVARLYPHEVSGGMGQRVMMAMMLIAEPELLIADEPTSALDVTVQLQVLGILDKLVRADRPLGLRDAEVVPQAESGGLGRPGAARRGMGLIFISHDLRLVASFCDRILVMYAGRVVEEIAARDLAAAKHPYTQGLLNCLPQLGGARHPLPTLQRQESWNSA
ncbi:ABC transporter ATP-binding protein [Roseateles oligotrophus]|uniref:ABC transporter ATP-binding protein n=1 Tax=Roseateles oligotrophus TaxID=1769250 RepID=A0ABT2YAK9_9BURK|nr:ABC transporter ATP-binding protein [Roseateles oligotrophus]MCV2367084.1 ABC transporter ATP-binding protein [Roseateles oligotrophus]